MNQIKFIILIISLVLVQGSRAQLFSEVSEEVGLNYHYPGNDTQEVGAGLTIIDFNNDGWDDLFQAGGVYPSRLWKNIGGKYVDVSEDTNIENLKYHFVQAAVAGDFDNDGFEDLFICNMGEQMKIGDHRPPVLLKNIGGEYFKPIFEETFSEFGSYTGAVWGDINNDGFIDLYVLNYVNQMGHEFDTVGNLTVYKPDCYSNKMFINEQGKGFREVSEELTLDDSGCGLAANFTDYDNDGDLDIMLLNDFGSWNHKGNKLFRNEYPDFKFTDVSNESGFYNEFYGMGIGSGDVNNDGYVDYYLTNIGENHLLISKNGSFKDVAAKFGVDEGMRIEGKVGTSWTGLLFDFDNDFDDDLFIAKGYLNSIENVLVKDPNKFFVNKKGKSFEDLSNESGLNDSLSHRGSVITDFDHDGDLDIISSVIKLQQGELGRLDQKIKLYRNNLISVDNRVILLFETTTINGRSIVGASVTVTIGKKKLVKQIDGGSGHGSQSSRNLIFGCGTAEKIKELKISCIGLEPIYLRNIEVNNVYIVQADGNYKSNTITHYENN